MPYITNPLDEYQSYSVHYVMLACRSTQVAAQFVGTADTDLKASLAAVDKAVLGGEVRSTDGGSSGYLVLDTRRYSQFAVDSLKYDVWINGLQTNASQANIATDLTMSIADAGGISFANFMQELMNEKLKTNFDGLVFLLRVIFVGHLEDGSSTTIQSETIPMHLSKLDINLDYAKGHYDLTFMPNMNFDVRRYKRFLTVSTATNATTGAGNTLGGLIQSFEDSLNRRSEDYYKKIQAIAEKTNLPKPFGRKVQYLITLPGTWTKFLLEGSSVGKAPETIFNEQKAADEKKTAAGKPNETHYSTKTGATITDVLDSIFKQVPEVVNLGLIKPDDAGNRQVKFYKHIVGITSTDTIMTVHVDVVEFIVPDLFAKNAKDQVSRVQSANYGTPVPIGGGRTKRELKDVIEWDYIFTGKNDSILNFDIKIEDFQFLRTAPAIADAVATREAADKSGNRPDEPWAGLNELIYSRPYDPMVLPLDIDSALKNFSEYTSLSQTAASSRERAANLQQYTKNLSMFYAGSPTVSVITIRGNPKIMHKFNIGKILPAEAHGGGSPSSNQNRESYRRALEEEILKQNPNRYTISNGSIVQQEVLSDRSYAVAPVFAKINIKGPNIDPKSGVPNDDSYTTSVLTDNHYTIFKLTNNFSGQTFTQDLELYNYTVFGYEKNERK